MAFLGFLSASSACDKSAHRHRAETPRRRFTGNDSSQVSHGVSILHNATSIYTNTMNSPGQVDSFSMNVTVAKGDTVSFVVDTGSTWTNLSTGLQATLF